MLGPVRASCAGCDVVPPVLVLVSPAPQPPTVSSVARSVATAARRLGTLAAGADGERMRASVANQLVGPSPENRSCGDSHPALRCLVAVRGSLLPVHWRALTARCPRASASGRYAASAAIICALLLGACGSGRDQSATASASSTTAGASSTTTTTSLLTPPTRDTPSTRNIYSADAAGDLSPAVRGDPALVYVPNSMSNTVYEISQRTLKVVRQFPTGRLPQHVTPAYDLKTLYVDNDVGNSLTPIDPRTGRPGRPIPVEDPYNLYFTPDGRYAIVVAERLQRLDFRNPHTMRLVHSLSVPMCCGVDHMDFSADGRYAFASCEFDGRMIEVDLRTQRVIRTLVLDGGKRKPPGRQAVTRRAHAVYGRSAERGTVGDRPPAISRDRLPPHRSRGPRALSEPQRPRDVRLQPRRRIDLGGQLQDSSRDQDLAASASGQPRHGRRLGGWAHVVASGRYDAVVYAIDTRTGRLRAAIPVGVGPHGLCVWPQPGRYSLGHTGILR